MTKTFRALAVIGLSGLLPLSALATTGRDALAACTNNPSCRVHLDADGGMVIQVGGHVIYCPPEGLGECEVVYRRGNGRMPKADLSTATEAGNPAANAVVTPEALLKN